MLIIAHRGYSAVAPQNTFAAFEAAYRAGADLIELDVHLLADGNAAVIHDDTVDATTDASGPVAPFTARSLAALDAGSSFDPAFAGQRVPTFAAVVDWLGDRDGISILLEFKGPWPAADLARITASIEAAGLADRFIVQSFDPTIVAGLRDLAPNLRRELLIEEMPEDVHELATELGVQGVNPDARLLLSHPDFVDEMHAAGLHVSVWTLNEPAHWAAAVGIGVDAIITDAPGQLRGFLAATR